MIIHRPVQLDQYYLQRQRTLKCNQRGSAQLKHYSPYPNLQKRKSTSLLDSKKIRSKLSQILKEDPGIKRSQSAFNQAPKNRKQNFRQYFHRTFLKKKQKKDDSRLHHLTKEKMEIIDGQDSIDNTDHSFNIREIKVRRKGSPFIIPQQKVCLEEMYSDRYCKVLTFVRTRLSNQKYCKKPAIPPIPTLPQMPKANEKRPITNNFLKTKSGFKQVCEKGIFQKLQPWEKVQQVQNIYYDL